MKRVSVLSWGVLGLAAVTASSCGASGAGATDPAAHVEESVQAQIRAGHETGNGGTVVIDGGVYQIADLHFKPAPYNRFEMSAELKAQLKTIEFRVKEIWGLSFYSFNTNSDLFNDHVFGSQVEYRFVNQLPPGCTFIPEKNLPAGLPRLDTGCTQGAITYLLPQEFVKLDLLQQALLILHERFHSYAPNEPYEVKAAVISGIYSLFAKYDTLKEGEELSAETLEVLNGFIGRFRQLSRSKFGRNLTFHSNGSIYDPSDVGTGVTVGFKTRISGLKIRGNVSIEKSELICFGETLVAVDLQIRGTSGCVSGTIYRGHIVDSGVGIEIQGDDVEIVRSQVLDASSGAESKLSARRIQIMDSITSGSIDAREIEVKKSEVACKIVSKGRVLLNEVKSLNTEHRLWRATTLELETGFLGGVTIERSQWNDQVDRVYAIKANEIVIRDSSFIDARARIDALSVNANVELREVTLRGVYLQGQGMKLVRASLARVDSVKDGNFTGVTSIGQLELSNAHLELIARDAGWTEVEVGRKNGHLTLDGRGQKYQFSKTQSLKSQRDLDKRLVK